MSTEMTSAEIRSFLDAERTLVLVTLRKDGSPIAHPMWFTLVDDGVYVDTRSDSLKVANIAADARVCAVVESGETYFELRGVRIEGRCRLVTHADEIARVHEKQAEKADRIGSGLEGMPEWFADSRSRRLGQGRRALLRIPMERVYSWDFSKARAHYKRSGAAPATEGTA